VYVLIEGESRSIEASTQLSAFFYFANWQSIFGKINTDLGHLWSLSLEEQFYLVWPLTLLGLLALLTVVRRISVIVAILVACVVAVVVWRIVLWNGGTSPMHLYVRTDTRADSLLIGALLGILWIYRLTPRRGVGLAATAAVALLAYLIARPIGLRGPFFHLGGFTLVAVAAAVVILAALESKWFGNAVLRFKPLCAIGVVSYGLYLWHLPIFAIVSENTRTWERWQRFVLAFVVTGAATAMSWFLLERPFLKWKDRLERRPRGASPGERGETEPAPPVEAVAAATR
jgi:peptidoglycan/LPS O-acetylase OafA/YrhL